MDCFEYFLVQFSFVWIVIYLFSCCEFKGQAISLGISEYSVKEGNPELTSTVVEEGWTVH